MTVVVGRNSAISQKSLMHIIQFSVGFPAVAFFNGMLYYNAFF